MSITYIVNNLGQFLLNFLINLLVNPFCYIFIVILIIYKYNKKRWIKILGIISTVLGVVFILSTLAVTFFDVYVYPWLSSPLYLWVYPRLIKEASVYLLLSR